MLSLGTEEPPKYLTENYFEHALEEGLCDAGVKINKMVFAKSSGPGENYCSNIFRVKLYFNSSKYSNREVSIFIKSITITPATQFLDDLAVFLREKLFYFDVLGKLEIISDDGSKFAAKCIYAAKEPIQTIVFEDLAQHGYKLACRQTGLDKQHCKILLRKLAKFHASSMVLLKKEPTIRENFNTGMLDEKYIRTNVRFANFAALQLRTLAEEVSQWQGFNQIANKLHRYCDNIKDNLVMTGRTYPDDILVLNHGDLWVNNFMFKYNDQKPIDVMFVDFQNCFFGSPGCDINFFLYSSVHLNILINNRDSLLKVYYESLRNSLNSMGFQNIPTFENIQMQVLAHENYGFFSMFSFLPMVAMKSEDSNDTSLEALSDPEFAKKKLHQMILSNPRTIETIKYALKRFDQLELFE